MRHVVAQERPTVPHGEGQLIGVCGPDVARLLGGEHILPAFGQDPRKQGIDILVEV